MSAVKKPGNVPCTYQIVFCKQLCIYFHFFAQKKNKKINKLRTVVWCLKLLINSEEPPGGKLEARHPPYVSGGNIVKASYMQVQLISNDYYFLANVHLIILNVYPVGTLRFESDLLVYIEHMTSQHSIIYYIHI